MEAAKHKFIDAYIEHTRQRIRQRIRAPVSGYVARRKAQVGDRVRPGQSAEVAVDFYGKSHTYHGTAEGFAPGTGSVFALLPPDNATGNFIHIVQRVPVRIALREEEVLRQPLRPGLSTVTAIHVGEPGRPPNSPLTSASGQEYETDIFAVELAAAEQRAREIIMANLVPKNDSLESSCKASELMASTPPPAGLARNDALRPLFKTAMAARK